MEIRAAWDPGARFQLPVDVYLGPGGGSMVLITDDRDGLSTSPVKLKQLQQSKSRSTAQVHPTLHLFISEEDECPGFSEEEEIEGEDDEDEDFEEYDDTRSIASDDSFYPPDDSFPNTGRTPSPDSPGSLSFHQACCSNNAVMVKIKIRQGVSEDEVRETDKNNRTGLIVACYQGYVDVVIALAQCSYVDVNWQDSEGNTALITAAQAGHITICNYLLNYYPGLEIERRNCHGYTALMKAAMQGRTDCVRALMLAGADVEARDRGRGLTARQWALFTSRYDTAQLIQRLLARPSPEQCCQSYRPEWARLPALVAQSREPKGCLRRLAETLRSLLPWGVSAGPQADGVMDHMVRVTTACPVGKRRRSVQEIVRQQQGEELESPGPRPLGDYKTLFHNCRVTPGPETTEDRRASLQSPGADDAEGVAVSRPGSLPPLNLARRSGPGRPSTLVLPKLRVTKAPPPTYQPEKSRRKSSCRDERFLQIPKWRYKELKEERRRAEEAERRRVEEAMARGRLSTGGRK
ncbi:hypothetical protein AAFF_G00094530 [Aldrovandia affinis]|uniref:Ankyrin repeat domain-containing protein 33B n=1 Tax=Aldrovandia affinis TaxID=143900 RepID=A0AAD7WY33_9TELE|nr:hypothetical protein AAFF_G00094530 [Aldrovandia affinis]